jgi:hypothetical protein
VDAEGEVVRLEPDRTFVFRRSGHDLVPGSLGAGGN